MRTHNTVVDGIQFCADKYRTKTEAKREVLIHINKQDFLSLM